MLKSRILSLVVTIAFLLFNGCGGGGGSSSSSGGSTDTKAEVSYDLEDGTVVVNSSLVDEMSVVPDINASNYKDTLVFRMPNSGGFANYKVGDTLMSGASAKAPYGFLRKITAIDVNGSELVISTVQANLLEATNNLKIDYESQNISADQISSIELAQGVVLENMKLDDKGQVLAVATSQGSSLFDISIDHTFHYNGGDVTVSGRTTFDFGIIFKLETEYLVVPEYFKTSLVIDQGTKLSIKSSNGIDFQDSISIGSIQLAPISLSAIVIVPRIDLVLKADGTIEANFALSASESFHGEIGVEYKNDRSPRWKPIHTFEPQTDYALPNLESVSADMKANAGPQFSLMIYGVVGPYAYLSGFGELDMSAASASNINLTLDVGVEYELGVYVDILWVDENYKLVEDDLFRINLITLNNEALPDEIYLTEPMVGEFILYGSTKNLSAIYSGVLPSKVEFFVDDVSVGSDITEPFAIDWDTNKSTVGAHTVKSVSYDSNEEVISEDSVDIELREAKWREGAVSGISNVVDGVFLYNHGYVWGYDEATQMYIISESTDNGQTWSTYFQEGILHGSIWDRKGFIAPDAGLLAVEFGARNLYQVDQDGKTTLFDSFDANGTILWDFGLNNSGEIRTVSTDADSNPYIGKLTSTTEMTKVADISDTQGSTAVTSATRINFSRVSEDAIVYGIRFINETTSSMTFNYMLSHDGGDSWSLGDFNGVTIGFYDAIADAYFVSEDEIILVGTHYVDNTDYEDDFSAIQLDPESAFVLKTTDGGANWQRIDVATSGFQTVTFLNDKKGYASVNYIESETTGPKVFKTLDGGLTWSVAEEIATDEKIVRVQFSNEYSGVAIGVHGTVYRFSLN